MNSSASPSVAVIGGGPAGLMAAEVLGAAGVSVTVYDRMPSFGRKFLMAGRGGLNLTHSEPLDRFLRRYGAATERLRGMIDAFPPTALIKWADDLGQPTFVGSSGRVFPKAMKASPLLRQWLKRLEAQGTVFRPRRTWTGWTETGELRFTGPVGEETSRQDAVVLALGGGSWAKLGSDGRWTSILHDAGARITPFRPTNVGFLVAWSQVFRERFAGAPLKAVGLSFAGRQVKGEVMLSAYGLEGGGIYTLSSGLRDAVEGRGSASLEIDLRPDMSAAQIENKLARGRKGETVSNLLRKAVNLSPAEIGLLREAHGVHLPTSPATLAGLIKATPLTLTGCAPMDRAISTGGGVSLDSVGPDLMLSARPGVFLAGEMLDWEAPTGGYLLQASFATGRAAALGVLAYLKE